MDDAVDRRDKTTDEDEGRILQRFIETTRKRRFPPGSLDPTVASCVARLVSLDFAFAAELRLTDEIALCFAPRR